MSRYLKDFPELECALIECGMILGSVGVNKKEDKNYVLIKYNNTIKTADLRIQEKKTGGIEFCIYPIDKDYQNGMATFNCIGDFDSKTEEVTLRQIEFSEMGYATAGIVEDYEKGGHMVLGTTTDLIVRRSDEEQAALMAEANEAFGSKEATKKFFEKNAYKLSDRLLVEQYFRFDEDPMTYIKNFDDAFEALEGLLNSNVGFRRENFEKFPDNALLQVANDGVELMEVLATDSVEPEVHVVVINGFDYSRGITPYMASCIIGQGTGQNDDTFVYHMIKDRKIVDLKNRRFYERNADGSVSIFETTPDGFGIVDEVDSYAYQYKWHMENKYLSNQIAKRAQRELLGIEDIKEDDDEHSEEKSDDRDNYM